MLLHPLTHHVRCRAKINSKVEVVWEPAYVMVSVLTDRWTGQYDINKVRILDVAVVANGTMDEMLVEASEYFSETYLDDLLADPSIHLTSVPNHNSTTIIFYRLDARHQYFFLHHTDEDLAGNWLRECLDYADKANLFYYGTGVGSEVIVFHPGATEEQLLHLRESSHEFGNYDIARTVVDGNQLVLNQCANHTCWTRTDQSSLIVSSVPGPAPFDYHMYMRPVPLSFGDDVPAELVNLLHRTTERRVLMVTSQGLLEERYLKCLPKALVGVQYEVNQIRWRGTRWVIVTVNAEPLLDISLYHVREVDWLDMWAYGQQAFGSDLCRCLRDGEQFYTGYRRVFIKHDSVRPKHYDGWPRQFSFQKPTVQWFQLPSGIGETMEVGTEADRDGGRYRALRVYFRGPWPPVYKSHSNYGSFEKPLSPTPPTLPSTPLVETTFVNQNDRWLQKNFGADRDGLEEFGRKVQEQMRSDLPPLKFIRPGQIDLDRMAGEMSQTYGANPTNVRKMLEIWSQFVNQDPVRPGSFDRAGPTSAGWSPDGLFPEGILDEQGRLNLYEISARARRLRGRYVLRHRDTGVKVYVVRRRYGTVTLQSEDGQEFALNNDIVETVYDKEEK